MSEEGEKVIKHVYRRQMEDYDEDVFEITDKKTGEVEEFAIIDKWDYEIGSGVITVLINGAVDFEEYYKNERQLKKVLRKLAAKYPDMVSELRSYGWDIPEVKEKKGVEIESKTTFEVGKTYVSEVYGAYAYYCPHGIKYHVKGSFPSKDDVLIASLSGKYADISSIPIGTIELWKRRGANLIAIGKGTYFDLYEL